jgi:PAS domain S-box-containing protein
MKNKEVMHKLLLRQLKKSGLGAPETIDDPRWQMLLQRVSTAYSQADDERYTLERSIDISSQEMQTLYQQLKYSSESALSLERDRLKLVLKSIGHGLLLIANDGTIIDTNPASQQMLGWQATELIGLTLSHIMNASSIPDIRQETSVAECFFCCKKSTPLNVSYVTNPIIYDGEFHGAVLIFRDVTQQLQDERILIDARDQAERANTAKSEFLSRMSHELRTPLNAILGFGQMLEMDEAILDPIQFDNVKEILAAGYHLLDLINQVLDLAKIESGNFDVNIEQVSISRVLTQCLHLISPQAKFHQLTIVDEASENNHQVLADSVRLKQVLLNLISNAVKYNRPQGSITVTSETVDDAFIRIYVKDTGLGLSGADLSKLFTLFERLSAQQNVEGTGIGLVITKHLVQLMNGSIDVSSELNIGTTFWIDLPIFNSFNLIK